MTGISKADIPLLNSKRILGTVALPLPHLLGTFFIAALPTLLLSGVKEMFGVKWL